MRFAVVHYADPLSQLVWSAIPLSVGRTLQEMGHEVCFIGELTPQVPLFSRIKTQFYKRILNKVYVINRDPAVFAARASSANRRLKEAGPLDAILTFYLGDAAYLQTDVPIAIVHDASWTQLIDFYPGTECDRLAEETLRGGIELDRLALARCHHAIYSSQWAVEGVVRDYGVPRSKLSVAPFGSNFADAPRREDVQRYLLERLKTPMNLLFVGWDWHRTGGDVAVAIAREIIALGVPVELHVVGCRPDGELPSFVRVHGRLLKDIPEQATTLRRLFATSDLLVMPTRADTFGIVYGEAAAFGMPVIASNVGGVPEAVRGGWGLTLSLDTSPRLIAEWAVNLYQDRSAYERLAWLARDAYETRLNWRAFCEHLLRVVTGEDRDALQDKAPAESIADEAAPPIPKQLSKVG